MKDDHWKPSSSCCQQISFINIFSQSCWQVRLFISEKNYNVPKCCLLPVLTKKILVKFLNQNMVQRSSWVKLKDEFYHWISDMQRKKKFTKLISISAGSCKHLEGMELWDCFKEETTPQPGTTGLATEPALLCTQHQQMVHKLWKWSFSRSCLAPQLGRPGSQPARVIVLLGVTDFRAWHEPKYAVKELEIKLAGSHKGQIENLPAREDFTARAEELTHFLSCFPLNEDTFPT